MEQIGELEILVSFVDRNTGQTLVFGPKIDTHRIPDVGEDCGGRRQATKYTGWTMPEPGESRERPDADVHLKKQSATFPTPHYF